MSKAVSHSRKCSIADSKKMPGGKMVGDTHWNHTPGTATTVSQETVLGRYGTDCQPGHWIEAMSAGALDQGAWWPLAVSMSSSIFAETA